MHYAVFNSTRPTSTRQRGNSRILDTWGVRIHAGAINRTSRDRPENDLPPTADQSDHYEDQLAIVDPGSTIRGYAPSVSDVLALDWEVYNG